MNCNAIEAVIVRGVGATTYCTGQRLCDDSGQLSMDLRFFSQG